MEIQEDNAKIVAHQYESLMRHLHPTIKTNRNGCDKDLMIKLICSEFHRLHPIKYMKWYKASSISNQIEKIVNHIYKGIQKLQDKGVSESDLSKLLKIEEKLEHIHSARGIMVILKELELFKHQP